MELRTPFTVIDGGLSTVLEAAGHDLRHPLWTARLLAENPDALVEAHLAYLRAGPRWSSPRATRRVSTGWSRPG